MHNKLGHRARILIVEDEPLIALDLESILLDADFDIADVTGNLETALLIVESGSCDAVLLDANLHGVSSAPVATALATRGLPFLVLSGYALDQQAQAFRAGQYLPKPVDAVQLIKSLNLMLSKTQA